MHVLPNTRRDRAKEIAKVQIRDQGVRHVQEQLQPVAFALQLPLRASGGLEVQRVINRQCHYVRDQREKANFFVGIGVAMLTADDQRPQPAMHRGQGKCADRLNPVFPKQIHHAGKASLLVHGRNQQRLLVPVDPAGHRLFRSNVCGHGKARLAASLSQAPINLLRRFVVLGHADGIEFDDLAQFGREETKQVLGIAMRADRLRETN